MADIIDFRVKNGLVVTSTATILSSTQATSSSTGALQVTGGAGIQKDLYVGGTIYGNISGTLTGNAATVSAVRQPGALTHYLTFVDSNNASATAEILYTSATISFNPTVGFAVGGTSTATAMLDVTGSTKISGITTVTNTTNASSTTTGALQVVGGAGFGGNIHLTGDIQQNNATYLKGKLAAGTATRLFGINATDSIYIGSVDADHTGGMLFVKNGVQQVGISAAGQLSVSTTTNATSTTTGALTVTGGAGIGGNLYVGGSINSIGGPIVLRDATTSSIILATLQQQSTTVVWEFGRTDISNTPAIDFHTNSGTDYDARISASNGSTTTIGQARLDLIANQVFLSSTQTATSTTTGALTVTGGAGIGGNLYVGGLIVGTIAGTVSTASAVSNALTMDNSGSGAASGTTYNGSVARTISYNTVGAPAAGKTVAGTTVANGIVSSDTRNVADLPGDRQAGLYVDFKSTSTSSLNDGGLYNGVITWRSYGTTNSDFSGGQAQQIAYSDSNNLWHRMSATTSTWGTWYKFIDTNNTTTAVVAGATLLTGGTAGQLHYQTGPNATGFAGPGTSGNVLVSNGTGAPTYNNTLTLTGTNQASTTNTGALIVPFGGVGIGGNLYVGGNTVVAGNLTIQGTTVIVDSTVTSIADPIFILGTTASGGVQIVDDNKDRGIAFYYFSSTNKIGFFGYDDSTNFWTFVPDATITSEIVSGTKGAVDVNLAGGSAQSVVYQSAANTTAFLAASSTSGWVLQSQGTGAAPVWGNPTGLSAGSATSADTVKTVSQATSASYYLTFVDSNNASALAEAVYTTSTVIVNPSLGMAIGTSPNVGALTLQKTYSAATAAESWGQYMTTNYTIADTSLKQSLRTNIGATHTSGTISNLINVLGLVSVSGVGGTTTNAHNYWSRMDNSTNATVTNAFNYWVEDGAGSGGPVNLYGLYVNTLTKGTNNYAVYTAGTTQNYFGGLTTFNSNITVNGGTLGTSQTTFNIANSTATTINFGGAGTAISIGASTGYTAVANQFTVTNTTAASSTATGALQVRGGAGIAGNLYVGGSIVGTIAGTVSTASAVTTVGQTTSATYYLTFVDSNNATALAEAVYTTSSFTINPSTGDTTVTVNTGSTNGLSVYHGAQYVTIRGKMGSGTNNNIVQAGDTGIIYSNGTIGTGNFVIAPWNATSGGLGLRMDSSGGTTLRGSLETKLQPGTYLAVRGAASSASNIVIQSNDTSGAAFWITAKTNSTLHIGANGASEPTTGAIVVDGSTNYVGVGTASPSALLQVGYSTTSSELLRLHVNYDTSRSDRGGIRWSDSSNVTGRIATEYDGSMVSMVFGSLYNSGYNSNNLMVIRGNGNIGVGTASPTYNIDVLKSTNDATIRTKSSAAGAYFYADSVTNGYYGTALLNNGVERWFAGSYGSGSYQITQGRSSSTASLSIDTNNNVLIPLRLGVGTTVTNTSTKFEVQGTAGQLFSVVDSFTGTIFSVNDVSGIPSIEVLDTGLVKFAQYNGQVAISTSTAQTGMGLTVNTATYITSLGVGTTSSGTLGEIRATNEITAYYSSDARLKENVKVISEPVQIIQQIRGVRFDWKDDYIASRGGEDGFFVRKQDVGVIAQEVESVLPEVVATREDGYKAVKYEKLVALLIEAVKEQQITIDTLKAEIADIKSQLVK